MLPVPGELFEGKYKIEEVLGEGGFARVYRATDVSIGRNVAIKLLHSRGHGKAAEARFLREIRVVASLDSPSILKVFDSGRTDDGALYMVCEYLPGGDLTQMMARGRLSERETVHIIRQILEALGTAHSAGVLHRDVKPDNVRVFESVNDPLRAKLMDFGIAKGQGDVALTATGKSIGTPRFMSPEQLLGDFMGPPSDIYSVGLIAFEMLTGRQSDHARLLANHERVALSPDDGVSPPLRQVVNRMLERQAAARYATAADALRALDELTTGELRSGAPERRVQRPTQSVEVQAPPERPRRALVISGIAAVVVCAGLFAVTAGDREPPEPPAPKAERRLPVGLVAVPSEPIGAVARAHDAGGGVPDAGPPDGCGRAPPFEGTGRMVSRANFGRREWLMHVPRGYDPQKRYPLVILLHDDMTGPADIMSWTKLPATADEHGFIIVAASDPDPFFVWQQADDMRHVRDAVSRATEELCVAEDRVFAAGFGAGSGGADILSCESWIRGVAMASYVHEEPNWKCTPARAVPVIVFLPTSSGWMPEAGGASCMGIGKKSFDEYERLWRDRNGCEAEPSQSFFGKPGATCRRWDCPEATTVSCRVNGGHVWPGAPLRPGDLARCDGTEQSKFPQTEALWAFFASIGGAE